LLRVTSRRAGGVKRGCTGENCEGVGKLKAATAPFRPTDASSYAKKREKKEKKEEGRGGKKNSKVAEIA